MMRRAGLVRWLAAAAGMLLLAACASPRETLAGDDAVTTGVLGNGMRWIVMRTDGRTDQAAMRLVIEAGSMHERPDEHGAAHMLEHMAYRGTRRYPDGEIQRRMGELGLAMGRDANASTGPESTIFKLDMPRNDARSLFEGLSVLRDIAGEMTIDPAMVEAERGVVLAEERARAGPAAEMMDAEARIRLGDHAWSRPAIGTRESIAGMSAETLKRFRDAWYRPERAFLVIVGDVDADALRPVIADQFGNWRGRGAAGVEPEPAAPDADASPRVEAVIIPGLADVRLAIDWREPFAPRAATRSGLRERLVRQLAAAALAQRMPGLLEDAGRPARFAMLGGEERIDGVATFTTAQANGVRDVNGSLRLLSAAQRQATQHGVTQSELDRVKQLRIEQARRTAASGRTTPPSLRADALATRARDAGPVMSPAQELAMLSTLAPTVTLDEVNAVVRAMFAGAPRVTLYAPSEAAVSTEALRAAFAQAEAAPVNAYAMKPVTTWPYADFGAPGGVVERREARDLGVTFVRFANGLKLTIKPTRFEPGRVSAAVSFGSGLLGMPRDRLSAADVGATIWARGGVNALTRVEQQRALAGTGVYAAMTQGDDAFTLQGASMADDLRVQLQLMAAMLSDPAYRTDTWDELMASAALAETAAASTPTGVMDVHLPALLRSGDLRWTFATAQDRATWTPDQAVAFIEPVVAQSPLDLVLVGDIEVERAIADVAATLGALPPRVQTPEPAGMRDVRFPAPRDVVTLAHRGREDQAALSVAWPTQQGVMRDPRGYRVAMVLGQILQDRATLKFRSADSASYAPVMSLGFSRALPDYGVIALSVELPRERVDAAFAQIDAIAEELARAPVSAEELRRAVGPRVEQARRERDSGNAYWMLNLQGAFDDPRALDMIRTQVSDYEGITAEDVRAAAARWLKAEAALRVKAVRE